MIASFTVVKAGSRIYKRSYCYIAENGNLKNNYRGRYFSQHGVTDFRNVSAILGMST